MRSNNISSCLTVCYCRVLRVKELYEIQSSWSTDDSCRCVCACYTLRAIIGVVDWHKIEKLQHFQVEMLHKMAFDLFLTCLSCPHHQNPTWGWLFEDMYPGVFGSHYPADILTLVLQTSKQHLKVLCDPQCPPWLVLHPAHLHNIKVKKTLQAIRTLSSISCHSEEDILVFSSRVDDSQSSAVAPLGPLV